MELLANIDTAIKNSGKGRVQVARELGISYPHLWRLLSGKGTMKAVTVAKLALITGSTPNDLYGICINPNEGG